MRSVSISKADVNGHRFAHIQRFPDDIIHSHHQFGCSWKPFCPRYPHLYYDQFGLRSSSPIPSPRTPCTVSRSNSGHRSPMSAHIPAGHCLISFSFIRLLKSAVDLRPCILCPDGIPIRRISRKSLIPEKSNSCGSILISKSRVCIIYPAVNYTDQRAASTQRIRRELHCVNTGCLPSGLVFKIKTFRFFDKLDFRKSGKHINPFFFDNNDRISIHKLGHGHSDLPDGLQRSEIFHDQFPLL